MSDLPERPPLTQEDRELLATPSEDLRKQTGQFSFDRQKFEARIDTGERWQQLLQAHLYFDHVITRMLADALPNPEAINIRRIGFGQKVQFVSAMSLLHPDLIAAVEFINGLRNKIAHDLNFEIDDDAVRNLINCTPKYLREIAEEEDGRRSRCPLLFHELLRVILFQVEVFRQGQAFERLASRKSYLRLRAVLDRADVNYAD